MCCNLIFDGLRGSEALSVPELEDELLGRPRHIRFRYLLYSAGQQKTTNLLALELDFFGEIGHRDRDQGG